MTTFTEAYENLQTEFMQIYRDWWKCRCGEMNPVLIDICERCGKDLREDER